MLILWCSPIDLPGSRFVETGQGIVTSFLYRSMSSRIIYFTPTLINCLPTIFRFYSTIFFATHPRPRIYIVGSRSALGFLRDIPALIPSFLGFNVYVHVHGCDLQKLLSSPLLGNIACYLYSRIHIILPKLLCLPSRYTGTWLVLFQFSSRNNYNDSEVSRYVSTDKLTFVWNSNLLSSKGIVEALEAFRRFSLPTSFFTIYCVRAVLSDVELSSNSSCNTSLNLIQILLF